MKVLISVLDADEAIEALAGGADIIDVKDPTKGSLGAPSIAIVESVKRCLPRGITVSVALGDEPHGQVVKELACAVEDRDVDYVKVGSLGLKSLDEAVDAYKEIRSRLNRAKLVVVAYADYGLNCCLNPFELLRAAYKSDCEALMIDTLIKNGRSTFDYLSDSFLSKIIAEAHDMGLVFALAGSLNLSHADRVIALKPDVVGFRGAACSGDRVKGRVSRASVKLIVKTYKPDNSLS
ncbi:MAG: (5-formylfuran-3-yl)methyl phosphate synthase [Candidatus Nezhaarchaeota archaeon]|nr:(5-formylfuran-3-yl)methyl phosphate synthase [Candidatus Nezhaarchaeota archaeon]MCX8141549.1 (5-formylfuran-3-yl)methyl phosphate synthase [Candidatus Nezhaarchaeota archaeon]MDW8049816.1 (5-formylfuran-3-yl)methyl phosphate synthase [Nitrososphaerota archaeon]